MSSKRAATLPKPPTDLAPNCTIADTAILTGTHPITIGTHTIISPRAVLTSNFVPLTIASTCLISDRAAIGLTSLHTSSIRASQSSVSISDHVIIEINAVVEAALIGRGTVIETGARIGKGAVVGQFCKIGPFCCVEEDEVVSDFTVVYGNGERRVDRRGMEEERCRIVAEQAKVLRKLVVGNLAKWQ